MRWGRSLVGLDLPRHLSIVRTYRTLQENGHPPAITGRSLSPATWPRR
jgi:hypothetical protein